MEKERREPGAPARSAFDHILCDFLEKNDSEFSVAFGACVWLARADNRKEKKKKNQEINEKEKNKSRSFDFSFREEIHERDDSTIVPSGSKEIYDLSMDARKLFPRRRISPVFSTGRIYHQRGHYFLSGRMESEEVKICRWNHERGYCTHHFQETSFGLEL